MLRPAVRAFLTLAVMLIGALCAPAAQAADPLTWVAPVKVDVGAGNKVVIRSVSCPSASLCLAAGAISNGGAVGAVLLKTTTPRDPSSWQVRTFPLTELEEASVWCASETKCYLSGEAWPSGSSASRVPRRAFSSDPAGPLSAWTIESAAATSLTCASETLCITEHFFPAPQNFRADATVPGPFSANYSLLIGPGGSAVSVFDGFAYACGRPATDGGSAPCLGTANTKWMALPATGGAWVGGTNADLASSFGAGVSCTRTFCAAAPDSGTVNYLDLGTQSWTKTAGQSGYQSPDVACAEDADGASRCIVTTGDFVASDAGILESAQPRSATPGDWRVTYRVFGSGMGSNTDPTGLACATSRTCVVFSFDGRVSAGLAPEAPAPTPTPTPGPAGSPNSGGAPAPPAAPTPIPPAPGSFTITLGSPKISADTGGNALFDMVVDAFASIGLKGALVQKATKGVGTGAAVRAAAAKPAPKPLLIGSGKAGADGKARVVGKLSKTGRTLLRKTGKLRVRVTITATSPSGQVVTKTADVTIRAAKKKKG